MSAARQLLDSLLQERVLPDAAARATERLARETTDPGALTKRLVQQGLLTDFQATHVLAGKTEHLILKDYVLLAPLGEGAMGKVYKARHRVMNRLVAVKTMRPETLETPQAVRRFEREMQVATQVDHPNIVRALDAGRSGSTFFYVMELVDGVDLSRLVEEEGPLPIPLACDFARQVLLGLQHIHERGGVHRDIKPQNLVAAFSKVKSDPRSAASYEAVKILDLGLALLRPPEADGKTMLRLTRVGAVMGTPDFMAPEQTTDAHKVDIRADLYSLGCSLFYLLTGQPLFYAGSVAQKLFQHREAPPPDLRQHRPEAPEALAQTLSRLLAKRPEERYPTPAAAAQALSVYCALAVPPAAPTALTVASTAAAPRGSSTGGKAAGRTSVATGQPPRPAPQPGIPPLGARRDRDRGKVRGGRFWAWVAGGALACGILLVGLLVVLLNRGSSEDGLAKTEGPDKKTVGRDARTSPSVEIAKGKGPTEAPSEKPTEGPKEKSGAKEPSPEATKESAIKLFNGVDLAGWTMFPATPMPLFTVQGGMLVCGGFSNGYLATDKDYGDYILTVKWRWGKLAEKVIPNSGIFVHVGGPDKLWPRGLEAQLYSARAGDLLLVDNFRLKVDPKRVDPKSSKRLIRMDVAAPVENPVGDWNTCVITCKGDSVRVEMNGQLVNEGTNAEPRRGKILLQSEGAEIHFKEITLQSVEEEKVVAFPPKIGKSASVNLFNGKDLEGWEGYPEFWSVKGGVIVARNNKPLKISTYLFTKDTYSDFRLIFSAKLVESEMHSGVAFWGKRLLPPEAMKDPAGNKAEHTYQGHLVMFPSGWGLYDLYRRMGAINPPMAERQSAILAGKQHDWNDMEILAQGNRIRLAVNGKAVLDWRDPDPRFIAEGPIALQLHSNSVPQEIHFRGLVLETFPTEDRLLTVK